MHFSTHFIFAMKVRNNYAKGRYCHGRVCPSVRHAHTLNQRIMARRLNIGTHSLNHLIPKSWLIPNLMCIPTIHLFGFLLSFLLCIFYSNN